MVLHLVPQWAAWQGPKTVSSPGWRGQGPDGRAKAWRWPNDQGLREIRTGSGAQVGIHGLGGGSRGPGRGSGQVLRHAGGPGGTHGTTIHGKHLDAAIPGHGGLGDCPEPLRQPVEEDSSEDPRTLRSTDPLHGEQREVDEPVGHEARAVEDPPVSEEDRSTAQADLEGAAGARADEQPRWPARKPWALTP